MVNAWVSKKPVKYWRAFTPRDIPHHDSKQKAVLFYEWNDKGKFWGINSLPAPSRSWSYNNIKNIIARGNKLIKGGIHETVIVEVHPKFRIGKYKNIEILNIYSENTQWRSDLTYKIYETEYYIKYNNNVTIVTETELINMTTKSNCCFVYTYQKGKNTFLHIKSKTNDPQREKKQVIDILSTPGLKFHFPTNPSFQYNKLSGEEWKYISTDNLPKKVWTIAKVSEPTVEYDNDKNVYNMHFTFMNLKKYYEGQIAKIKSSNIRDDLDSAFLKAAMTNSTKTASSHNRNRSKVSGRRCKRSLRGDSSEEHHKHDAKEETVYVTYTKQEKKFKKVPEDLIIHKKKLTVSRKEVTFEDAEIFQRCPRWAALKLQEQNPDVKILTILEYNKLRSTKYQKDKPAESVLHPEGTFNRKLRRLEKGKNRKRSRVVHTQYVSREISDNKIGNYPHAKHANVDGDKFITPSSITGAVIKVGNKLVAKDSLKPIYHHVKNDNRIITRHNAKKQTVSPLLQELKDKYGSSDRRYTNNSDVENWSIQFFVVLRMIKDHERHKKVINYITKKCGFSNEFVEGLIKYLQLTRNGDPTREHKRNPIVRYKRIKVTKPHLQVNSPDPRQPIVIEHEIANEDEGGVKNIITENAYVRYNKKSGLKFFTYNLETNEHIFVCDAKTIKKWVYVQEYKEDINKAKWHELVTVSTKEVDAIQNIPFRLERKVKGGRPKKWLSPIPSDKTVKYIIKLLLAHKKNNNDILLYSTILNKVMNEYKDSTDLYEKLRFTLYHNYSDLGKYIVTKIKANKMDDPDLVIFMEDLMNPHFN